MKTKKVWVAWTNTDRTEGRGRQIPVAVCETKITADRLGENSGVQGSNCMVTEETAVCIDNRWLVPGDIIKPTKADSEKQKRVKEYNRVLEKAIDSGITSEEVRVLKRGLYES